MTATALLLSFPILGCASLRPGSEFRQCSDTPKNAAIAFLEGLAQFSISILKAVTLPGVSLWAIFGGGDIQRGKELVRQLTTHPEVPEADRGCACSLLRMEDTPDPQEKVIVIKRETLVGKEERDYQRAFLVRFDRRGNCIAAVKSLDPAWIRIP